MKTPFAVGDRVKIFGWCKSVNHADTYYYFIGSKMKVANIITRDELVVEGPENRTLAFSVYPGQCKRLKPAQKRRRVWIDRTSLNEFREGLKDQINAEILVSDSPSYPDQWVEFIEVRKAKKK